MNSFTIRDIENLCGIRAHTLRAWERRYQLLCPKRKASNHRQYDSHDLKCLLRIAYLYHNGHKISKIARLDEQELCQLALALARTEGSGEIFIHQLTEASLDFDQERFDRVLNNIILQLGFEKSITQVVFPFLNKVGLLWLTGNVVPAQEHFASALITRKICLAINGLEIPSPAVSGRNVLIFSPKGEFHEMPLLYMHYLMKKKGIPAVYFGKNIAVAELKDYCAQKPVTHLYFHLVTNLIRCEPGAYLKKLAELFPDKQIVASGGAMQWVQPGGSCPNVRVLGSLEEMQVFAGEK